MRGTWSTTRCPAPVRSRLGAGRCIYTANRCDYPGHARWRRVGLLMAVVWWVKPWWPNQVCYALDRGETHTCPTVLPCRLCALGDPSPADRLTGRLQAAIQALAHLGPMRPVHRCGDPTCREDHR